MLNKITVWVDFRSTNLTFMVGLKILSTDHDHVTF